jgi:AcrR family transcriptional regulator
MFVLHKWVVQPRPPMKIADLEKASGVGRSTIHHYLNVGLLPAPRVTGPKTHLFDAEHLARLTEIRRLRRRGWPLLRIRERLVRRGVRSEPRPAALLPPDATRRRIVLKATPLFAERGYDGVLLSDVAREAGIGKATLYRYFPSKQALFVDCVERVRFTLVPHELRDSNEQRASLEDQGRNRAAAVLSNFAAFRTLSNLLGSVAHGRDPALAEQARAELHAMVTNAVPFLSRLMEARLARRVEPELLAYMLWYSLMGAGEWMGLDSKRSLPDVLEAYLEFTTFGMAPSRSR